MAWTTPLTAVANAPLTAAQWNASVRDNLLETAPAKATAGSRIIVTTGANSVTERLISQASIDTTETTGSTSYIDLPSAGPTVSIVTGTRALVWMTSQMSNSASGSTLSSYEVSGASSLLGDDSRAIIHDISTSSLRTSVCDLRSVTSGTNVFAMKYRVSSGTGTFLRRRLQIMAL